MKRGGIDIGYDVSNIHDHDWVEYDSRYFKKYFCRKCKLNLVIGSKLAYFRHSDKAIVLLVCSDKNKKYEIPTCEQILMKLACK